MCEQQKHQTETWSREANTGVCFKSWRQRARNTFFPVMENGCYGTCCNSLPVKQEMDGGLEE